MTRHIVLDSTPLSALCLSARDASASAITRWGLDCLTAGHHIYIAEVIDYELRRELLRVRMMRCEGYFYLQRFYWRNWRGRLLLPRHLVFRLCLI